MNMLFKYHAIKVGRGGTLTGGRATKSAHMILEQPLTDIKIENMGLKTCPLILTILNQ